MNKVECLEVGPIMTNCYLLYNDLEKFCFCIDPGADAQRIIAAIERLQRKVAGYLFTHGHYDHIGALKSLYEKYPAEIYIGKKDAAMLIDSNENLSIYLGIQEVAVPATKLIDAAENVNMEINCNSINIKVIETPGHTRGGVCYYVENENEPILFSGDTLFQLEIGRCDLPGGNYAKLISNVKEKIFILPEQTIVYPGHGAPTNIITEKTKNPYFKNVN